MDDTFRWFSSLGISVGLFLATGVLWILIGALTVPLYRPSTGATIIFVSNRTDTSYFGAAPEALLTTIEPLAKLRTLLLTVLSGFLLLSGSAFLFLAWFGLKQGQAWALTSLVLGILFAEIWWALALLPYLKAGVRLTLGDIPPFMWVPAILLIPAAILGWVGLR